MYFYKVKHKQIKIMKVSIKLKKIELNGKAVMWNKKNLGFKKFAGSVYFDNKKIILVF